MFFLFILLFTLILTPKPKHKNRRNIKHVFREKPHVITKTIYLHPKAKLEGKKEKKGYESTKEEDIEECYDCNFTEIDKNTN